jgi:hypothetical protein
VSGWTVTCFKIQILLYEYIGLNASVGYTIMVNIILRPKDLYYLTHSIRRHHLRTKMTVLRKFLSVDVQTVIPYWFSIEAKVTKLGYCKITYGLYD